MGRDTKPMRRDGPLSELARAKALWRERRFDEALRCFKNAVRQAPNNVSVLIDASRALGARFQMDRSMELLNKASRLGSRRADVQYEVGKSYRMLRRIEQAESCFRRACRLAPAPESALELAAICERRHALDEADDLIARVLRYEPRSSVAMLLRGRVERRRGDVEKARATLQKIIDTPSQHPDIVAEAYGELSVLLDAIGEYADAWETILKCKHILLAHEQVAWSTAQFMLARCSKMVDSLTADHFHRWQSTAECGPTQRLALLTGFPRTGTTLLEQVLDAHPEIVSCDEADVFSTEVFPRLGQNRPADSPIDQLLNDLSPDQVLEARAFYFSATEAILGEPIGSRLYLDKNPAMNLMIPAMGRVFPELKLVIALRDPRDVVISCFLRYLPINPVSVCFLTLDRTVDRFILDIGAWLKMRNMIGDWIEVRYENLVADLGGEARRTLRALNVPWDDSALQYRTLNPDKQVRSPSYEEVSRPIFTTSIGRWQNYERQLAPVLDKLTPMIEAFGYEK
jgi:tetratricopeptide (TPR) repeat protein